MLTRKHIVRYQWSEKAVSLFSISGMEIESIVEFSTINVLQFSRIREFCHDFNIGNFMNRGIPVVFESLVFHVPWNFGQVKTLETSRIVEFYRILRLRRGKQILGKQIRPNFLRSTSLQILANKSGCVQTNLLFFLYTTSKEKSVGHVITKFSGMGRFIYPWCSAVALRALSSANKVKEKKQKTQ